MKKSILILVLMVLGVSSLTAQIQWNELKPFQRLTEEEYINITNENKDFLIGKTYWMFSKAVTVCFMEEEPVYKVSKGKSKGPRMLICLSVATDAGLVFFAAVCADSLQENPALEIRYNNFGFCMQTLDSKGKNHLLYTGLLVDDIGFYPLGSIVIGTGCYENSFDCVFKEAPFYFWDKTSKKAMCFYSNGAELIKTNIKVENPLFGFSAESRGQDYRELYFMEVDPKTGEPNPEKTWLCSDCNFIKLEPQ